ncbi:MAG: DUF4198 domain-containing protein [Desulfovibrio sp.]|nr:DUF4198 domain-containing protein [Desulfovibrio sp.]
MAKVRVIVLGVFCAALSLFFTPSLVSAQVTLLIPAKPDISAPKVPQEKKEAKTPSPPKEPEKSAGKLPGQTNSTDAASQELKTDLPTINEEIDLLITLMNPFANQGFPMDMPQSFTVLRFNRDGQSKDGHLLPSRRDLLGDVEEILYKGQKAWGANVGLGHPGLFQFIMETKPWWDEQQERFLQQSVKVMLPVYGEDSGWYESAGQRFEIVPLTRPFGLIAPQSFTGRVLLENQPLPNVSVTLHRINTDGQKVPTDWHQNLSLRTNSLGEFSFTANRAGWWCAMAQLEGVPLKGADGQPKKLTQGTLFWFYVDSESANAR